MRQATEKELAFVRYLRGLADPHHGDRGALAALRRGLGQMPGTTPAMYPHITQYLPEERWEEWRFFLVAALFAWHDDPGGRGNLGDHFRALKDQRKGARGDKGSESDATDKRFVTLLSCHQDDLHDYLRQAVGLLESKQVPVNWLRLLMDLGEWDDDNRGVQRAWARSFYRSGRDQPGPGDPSAREEGVEP